MLEETKFKYFVEGLNFAKTKDEEAIHWHFEDKEELRRGHNTLGLLVLPPSPIESIFWHRSQPFDQGC